VDATTAQLTVQTQNSVCEVAVGFVSSVVPCGGAAFVNLAAYFDYSQQTYSQTEMPKMASLSLQFTAGQYDRVSAIQAPLLPNILYSSSVVFTVSNDSTGGGGRSSGGASNNSGGSAESQQVLPTGLYIDVTKGAFFGTPVAASRPQLIYVTQLTSLGDSRPCPNVLSAVQLSVVACDSRTCHGGQCYFLSPDRSPFGDFACLCPAGLIGRYCEAADPFVPGPESRQMALSFFMTLLLCAAVSVFFAHTQRLLLANSSLQERLLVTEEEVVSLHRAWLIQPSELKIEGEIARGAFGVVYRAVLNGDLPVAVKRLRNNILDINAADAEEFDREVSFMRTVRHPNIVMFYGAGIFDGTNDNADLFGGEKRGSGGNHGGKGGWPFLVTELMERGSLRTVLDNSPAIALAQKIRFARDTALGMQHLHSLGCIHRDLKSGNLLVTQGFRVKVADFGTARLRGRDRGKQHQQQQQQEQLHVSSQQQPQHQQQQQRQQPHQRPQQQQQQQQNYQQQLHQQQQSQQQKGFQRSSFQRGSVQQHRQMEEAQQHIVVMTSMVGTPLWMAPEVLFQQPYTQKADVYSYGIVLFEILTQQLPWNELPSSFILGHLEKALREGRRPVITPRLQPEDAEDGSSSSSRPSSAAGATTVEASDSEALYTELMQRCWAQSPDSRPTFEEVVAALSLASC
jgi:serine/threonine protein kinase